MIDATTESSRLLYIFSNETMNDEEELDFEEEITRLELTNAIYPRVTGLITIIGAASVIIMAWNRRKYLFHRLVLGMAIHQVLYGVAYTIGNLAIPREYTEYFGNYGTIRTCTAQGFILYVCARTSLIYYGSFSFYSYVAVLSNFDPKKYSWVEPWIHGFSNIYPIVSGIYLLVVQGFNPGYGFCKMSSYPLDCEITDDLECERGPSAFGPNKVFWLWLLPMLLQLVIPTIFMTVLYFKIKQREQRDGSEKFYKLESPQIAIQSGVYLSTVYWTVLPWMIVVALQHFLSSNPETLFSVKLAAQINFALFGLWSLVAYRYFAIERPDAVTASQTNPSNDPDASMKSQGSSAIRITSSSRKSFKYIFSSRSSGMCGENSTSKLFENSASESAGTTQCKQTSGCSSSHQCPDTSTKSEKSSESRRYSFNIFDGTNASGAWADFIHEGDSEDERMENEETMQWETVQEHI